MPDFARSAIFCFLGPYLSNFQSLPVLALFYILRVVLVMLGTALARTAAVARQVVPNLASQSAKIG